MARLPRFQESGLISADIPRMDFANVREGSRQAQTIGNALTRISEFAFGRVRQEREEQNRLIGMQARSELEAEVYREAGATAKRTAYFSAATKLGTAAASYSSYVGTTQAPAPIESRSFQSPTGGR